MKNLQANPAEKELHFSIPLTVWTNERNASYQPALLDCPAVPAVLTLKWVHEGARLHCWRQPITQPYLVNIQSFNLRIQSKAQIAASLTKLSDKGHMAGMNVMGFLKTISSNNLISSTQYTCILGSTKCRKTMHNSYTLVRKLWCTNLAIFSCKKLHGHHNWIWGKYDDSTGLEPCKISWNKKWIHLMQHWIEHDLL